MKLFLKMCVIVMLAVTTVGCSSGASDEPGVREGSMAMLTLNVYAGDPGTDSSRSRAEDPGLGAEDYYDTSSAKYERMHTLRVIVVRPNGKVEHNEFLTGDIPDEGSSEYHGVTLEVVGGEKKTVYIFANEAAVEYNFNNLTIGSDFPTTDIESLQLTAHTDSNGVLIDNSGANKTYIPMSESFEIDVKNPSDNAEDLYQSADLFITRAAVKFGFFFSLKEGISQDIYVKSITFSKLGNTEYLLPNDAVYSPAKDFLGFYDRYIYQYKVPEDANNYEYTFSPEDFVLTPASADAPEAEKVKAYIPELYFSETGLSSYTVTVTLMFYKNKEKKEEEVEEVVAGPLPLENLPCLPRNTYVKINAKLGLREIEASVDVLPYTAVWLEPEFGFDELLPHVPVIGEKPPWVEIWPPNSPDSPEPTEPAQ